VVSSRNIQASTAPIMETYSKTTSIPLLSRKLSRSRRKIRLLKEKLDNNIL
jgi:hypothetical protein